jgi:hypothetical protein
MSIEKMPDFEPPPIDTVSMQTSDGQRRWVQDFCEKAAEADLRYELEKRREERLKKENRLMRLAFRMLHPVLADPLEIMFGPRQAGYQEKQGSNRVLWP